MRLVVYYLAVLIFAFLPLNNTISKISSIIIPVISIVLTIFTGDFQEVFLGEVGIRLGLDTGSRYFLILTSLVYIGVALYRFKDRRSRAEDFFFLSSFSTLSLTYMSFDLFNMYVMLEVLSVQAGLMIIGRLNTRALWSALKYLIVGVVGTNIYLIGVGIVYSANHTFDITRVTGVGGISAALILTGLMVRTGVFGLGMWLPSFHTSAPNYLSALLSSAFVKSGVYVIYRMGTNPYFSEWLDSLKIISPFLLLGGALLSLSKRDLKSVIATSSMAHLGFMMASPNLIPEYSLIHAVAKAPLFLNSTRKVMGILEACAFSMFIASIIGVPMTAGGSIEKLVSLTVPSPLRPVVWISSGILGYSIFSRWKISLRGWRMSIYSTFFMVSVIVTSFLFFEKPKLIGTVPLVLSITAVLILGERVSLRWLEKLEKLDNNLAVVLIVISAVMWGLYIW